MNYKSIKYHLRPYNILQRRRTTINHAFAAAIAPYDEFDDERIRNAVKVLGQDPDQPLRCVYCEGTAQTWDHVTGTVKDSRFSGHGHRIGNLLPSCKGCNSSKGNKPWRTYISQFGIDNKLAKEILEKREYVIQKYLDVHAYNDVEPVGCSDYDRLLEIREFVFSLIKEADILAEKIRRRTTDRLNN